MAPVHCAAGSDGETNFGVNSLAAANAASSSLARFSWVARLTACASSSLLHRLPGIDRCLLASATIRLASTAKPSPPTRPAPMQAPTTRSKTGPGWENRAQARNVPNSNQEPQRSRELDDRPVPPRPGGMNRKTAPDLD